MMGAPLRMNKVTPIEKPMTLQAKELTLSKLEHEIKNHREPVNGYAVDTMEYDWADLWIMGWRACQNGDPCPEGSNSTFVRGYGVKYEHDEMMARLGK